MTVHGWGSDTAAALADMSYRQLDHLVRCGIITPSVPARGSGTKRTWSEHDISILRVCARLRELGAEAPVLAKVVTELRELDPVVWDGVLLVHPSGRVQIGGSFSTAAWVVDLASTVFRAEALDEAQVA